MESVKYFLALEKRPGDNSIIDINKLDIYDENHYNLDDSIASIDNFASNWTEQEIKESVARTNIVTKDYLNGSLKIVSNFKHCLPVLTKEVYVNMTNVLNSAEFNQALKDKVYSNFRNALNRLDISNESKEQLLASMRSALKTNSTDIIQMLIGIIPHTYSRHIYFVLYDEHTKNQKDALIRSKKLNDKE